MKKHLGRTSVNVTGNCMATIAVAEWEEDLDKELIDKKLELI